MTDGKRLSEINVGECCRVREIDVRSRVGKRLADLGAARGVQISCVGASPLGDPRAYLLLGSIFAIRNGDAAEVGVEREEVARYDKGEK